MPRLKNEDQRHSGNWPYTLSSLPGYNDERDNQAVCTWLVSRSKMAARMTCVPLSLLCSRSITIDLHSERCRQGGIHSFANMFMGTDKWILIYAVRGTRLVIYEAFMREGLAY